MMAWLSLFPLSFSLSFFFLGAIRTTPTVCVCQLLSCEIEVLHVSLLLAVSILAGIGVGVLEYAGF